MNKYKIAGLVVGLDFTEEYLHKNLKEFEDLGEQVPDLFFDMKMNCLAIEPTAQPLIDSPYLRVYTQDYGYELFYPTAVGLNSARYHVSSHQCTLCVDEKKHSEVSITDAARQEQPLTICDYIFFAIRDIFFLAMQEHGMLAVHSSTFIYQEKAYVISASSGTGKSTHTNMWMERYGVSILDGDVIALRPDNNQVLAYGLPWCGTSNQYQNLSVTLGAVIFIAQSCHNSITKLTPFEATLRLAARCFTPTWTKALTDRNITIAEQIIKQIPCAFLGCLPNTESVDITKKYIDSLS